MSSTSGPPADLASRIAARRREMRLTQRELAQQAGIPAGAVAKLESREIRHSKWLHKLAQALRTSTSYLLDGESAQTLDYRAQPASRTMPANGGVDATGFLEILTVRVLSSVGPGSPRPAELSIPLPATLLPPHCNPENLAFAQVDEVRAVVADQTSELSDGQTCLLRWRDTFVVATVTFSARGFTLRREEYADELTAKQWHEQIEYLGRIVATFARLTP